jgi:hypothetical protein
MLAWATGLLTNTACSICGSLRSAMNCPRPVSRRLSSRRETERPIRETFEGPLMLKSRRPNEPPPKREDGILLHRIEALVRDSKTAAPMSALGQKRTLRFVRLMSALPPKSGHCGAPLARPLCAKSGLMHCNKPPPHSITSSARASKDWGTAKPSAFAVFKLMASSYLLGACTGKSAGFSPLSMRST